MAELTGSTDEVAERLGISPQAVRRLARTEGLPHFRVGRVYRYPWTEVEAWLRERSTRPAEAVA